MVASQVTEDNKIPLIQQRAGKDKQQNIARGLAYLEAAARNGARLAC